MRKILVVGLGQMGQFYLRKLIELGVERTHIVGVDIDPLKVNASAFVLEQICTEMGMVPVSLRSSFINPIQVRRVGGVLAHRDTPYIPVFTFEFNFDRKREGKIVDELILTTLEGNRVEVKTYTSDKLLEQTDAFLKVMRGEAADSRLTGYDDAHAAVAFTHAVTESNRLQGEWSTAYSKSDVLDLKQIM